MQTTAVVLEQPEHLVLSQLELTALDEQDVVVAIDWSGISTGTERLLWSGQMPGFPGMGYPLVPGYESVGRIESAGAESGRQVGDYVFVPGANCFADVRGLFGGAAARLIVPGSKVIPMNETLGEQAILLALAATAYHACAGAIAKQQVPDLIVGHGVLGRLLARLTVMLSGKSPTVWEHNPQRRQGTVDYPVIDPDSDDWSNYKAIYDVSGDATLLDKLIARLAPGGEIVLAGFYSQPLSFAFPPAFMREARIRIAAEWQADDIQAVKKWIDNGQLSLDGLITHRTQAQQADSAYQTAFNDASCLKMVLDWRNYS